MMSSLAVLTLAIAAGTAQLGSPSIHQPDTAPVYDAEHTIPVIGKSEFSLQYATGKPCETKIEVRQGEMFDVLSHGSAPSYRVVDAGETGLWHQAHVTGLKPGKRYYYRI